jgi:hypothetical protein
MGVMMDLTSWAKRLKFREDLPFLLNYLGLKGRGVEVGVHKGVFASHILEYWEGERLYLVDSWRHIEGYVDSSNGDHNVMLDNMAKTFMAVYAHENRAVMIRDLSAFAAQLFPPQSLDFVYIDADHAYEAVVMDIQAWASKVKPGGIMSGHDYLNSTFDPQGPWIDGNVGSNRLGVFGVKKAVDEWAEANGKTIYVIPGSPAAPPPSWWTQM